MKRFCFLAVLMALSFVSAYAGTFDFIQRRQTSGAHRIRPGIAVRRPAPRCRSPDVSAGAASATRYEDDRDAAVPAKPVPACRRRSRRPRRPSTTPPAQGHRHRAAAPSTRRPQSRELHRRLRLRRPPAAGSTGVRYQCRRRRRSQNRSRPRAPGAGRTCHASGRGRSAVGFSDRRLADRRQGNGADRKVRRCAVRLRARFIEREGRSDPDQHEAEDGKAMDRRRLQPGLVARRITARCR